MSSSASRSPRRSTASARSRVSAFGCNSRIGLRRSRISPIYQQLSMRTGLALSIACGFFRDARGGLLGFVLDERILVEGVSPLVGCQADVFGQQRDQFV